LEGHRLPVTHASFIPLMHNYDRNVRKDAFESLYRTYSEHKNTSAAILSAQMKQLNFFSKMRKYNSPLEAALDSNNVDPQVYYNLIDAVHENMDSMYKYVRLRKKLLKVDALHMYDLYVPIVANAERDIPFAETKENIREALSVLGDDYVALLDEGFRNRWIDIYENPGKRSGAYSSGCRVHPYVLLNYKNNLDSEFTTAHEMGHALHSYLSNKNQPVVDAEYVIFVAEVASTCNEALLMQYLLKKTTDKKERAYLINYFLEQFRTTLYRQTMFAEFELKMSQLIQNGESINSESACRVYHDLIDLYFGKDIVHDAKIDLEWARIPHFFYNFYVYQYATGFSAAIALSQKILNEGEPAVKAYKENFLSAGCSKDPVSILKDAGVDMSTKKPVEDALKLFDSLIDELAELMR
ncbi:MAG: oligoendopeptidase F family protein, partial [Lachnospiraceae bacterium]|nr:oligoendopeptidase F family protein [Lachnospiraceae bacterium]